MLASQMLTCHRGQLGEKSQFILDLLSDKYGIRCVIASIGTVRFIILDNDDFNMPVILSMLIEEFEDAKGREKKAPDIKFIKDSLATINTEYDKTFAIQYYPCS